MSDFSTLIPIKLRTLITILLVSSCLSNGIPEISRHSRLMYCSSSLISSFCPLTVCVELTTSSFSNLFSVSTWSVVYSTSLVLLCSSETLASTKSIDSITESIFVLSGFSFLSSINSSTSRVNTSFVAILTSNNMR